MAGLGKFMPSSAPSPDYQNSFRAASLATRFAARSENAEINDRADAALRSTPDAFLCIWMKPSSGPYGCFCHQLSTVTPNNGMVFGCASLLE